jgi:hypothetical protein
MDNNYYKNLMRDLESDEIVYEKRIQQKWINEIVDSANDYLIKYFLNKYYPNKNIRISLSKVREKIKHNPILFEMFINILSEEDFDDIDNDKVWVVKDDLSNLFSKKQSKQKQKQKRK